MTTFDKRLVFDHEAGEIRDADRRYMLMRPDVLMGALARLDAPDLARVLQALADSAAENGGKSVHAYFTDASPTDEQFFEIIRSTAAALGWGQWAFESATGSVRLTVHNSPFAAGFGSCAQPVCAPISGVLRSVVESVVHGPVLVTETACAAQGAAACRFVATRK
jgi:predicted hydrocarbon binding protein